MTWKKLKKSGVSLHVEYGETFANDLYGYDAKFRTGPPFEISLDLNRNLRTRNKTTNTYVDAQELADGDINQLKLVQIIDEGLFGRLASEIQATGGSSAVWTLAIELGGRHIFQVKPERDDPGETLYLHVLPRLL